MFGSTQLRAQPQQSIGFGSFGAQQTNGIDIGSLMGIMIPMMIVVMMMKMMTGAFGQGNSKKLKPVETAS